MKTVIRAFFRTLRLVLGPVMLLKERLTQPTGMKREPAAQATVEKQCQSLALYQFSTCPFCIKVRQEMRRLSLPIEKRDAQHNLANRDQLLQVARPKCPACRSPKPTAKPAGCKTRTPSWLTCASDLRVSSERASEFGFASAIRLL
jgi:hypothetical protein